MAHLSADELRRMLKEQLDDPAVTEITDERLLVGGLLDTLLAESPEYEERYRMKARSTVLDIYQMACMQKGHTPVGFWESEQGLMNAGMILRPMIAWQGWAVDRKIFEKFTAKWLHQERMRNQVVNHGLYRLMISSYPEYLFDLKRPNAFHLHWWDVQRCFWTESKIREAVRHTVHFHMPWGLSLRELVARFHVTFLREENLYGIVSNAHGMVQFHGNAYRLFVFVFPEYVFDSAHPDRPHVHDWDAPCATHWSDDYVREAVRHMVKYHTNWKENELAHKVTIPWLREIKLQGMITQKFRSSPFRLLQFVYPELFEQGILSEENFRQINFGIGAARFRHLLRAIPKNRKHAVTVGKVRYAFPDFGGYLMHKLSGEYGALYTPDKQLIGVFRWNTDPNLKYISIRQADVEPVPPELTRLRPHLALAEVVRVLADEARIVVHALPLKDQAALTEALNTVQQAQVVDYLKLTGETGLRAMADTEFYAALVHIHESFDPVSFRQVLANYNVINTKLPETSALFIRRVTTVPQKALDTFRAEIHAILFDASDRIVNTLSKALTYQDQNARNDLIGDVLQAQRDLLAMIEALDAFGRGTLRSIRRHRYQDGTQEIHYTRTAMDVYLILRPRGNPRGQARIGFRIVPQLPADNGLSHELYLRLDRETPTQTALDIHSDALVSLNRLDRRVRSYHYTVNNSQFADVAFFEQIVQSFLKES